MRRRRWASPATAISTRWPAGSASTPSPRWRTGSASATRTTCRSCRASSPASSRTPPGRRRRREEPGSSGETLYYGIGQGFILAPPLQLAVMAARLANGGMAVKPRLIRRSTASRRRAEPASCCGIPDGILASCATACTRSPDARGTAYRRGIVDPAMRDGRQDRHRPGAQHHRGRAAGRRQPPTTSCLEAARPRAVRLLRALRRAALRHGVCRARRRRLGGRGAARATSCAMRSAAGCRRSRPTRRSSARRSRTQRAADGGARLRRRPSGSGMSASDLSGRGMPARAGEASIGDRLGAGAAPDAIACAGVADALLGRRRLAGSPGPAALIALRPSASRDAGARAGRPPRLVRRCAYRLHRLARLLVAVEVVGEIGMGAQRWLDLGLVQHPAVRDR